MKTVARILLLSAAAAAALSASACLAANFDNIGDPSVKVSDVINDYKPKNVVETKDGADYSLGAGGGASARVTDFVTKLTQLGALLAIAGIVYSGFLMVSSTGDDEKASAGKKGLIWSAAGFAAMILAGPAVNAVINLAYQTYGK